MREKIGKSVVVSIETFALAWAVMALACGGWAPVLARADQRKTPASQRESGKSVTTEADNGEKPRVRARGVKSLSPGGVPGTGSAHVGPGAESSMGAGIEFDLGRPKREVPPRAQGDAEDAESDPERRSTD